MSSSLLVHLKGLLSSAAEPLSGVTWRRMFGCEAAFARDQIFGLIWKDGRIGLKLPEASAELLQVPGAAPWAPGGSAMRHWVLVPEELHDDEEELARWVARAHAQVLAAPPKPSKAARPAADQAPRAPRQTTKTAKAAAKPAKATTQTATKTATKAAAQTATQTATQPARPNKPARSTGRAGASAPTRR